MGVTLNSKHFIRQHVTHWDPLPPWLLTSRAYTSSEEGTVKSRLVQFVGPYCNCRHSLTHRVPGTYVGIFSLTDDSTPPVQSPHWIRNPI